MLDRSTAAGPAASRIADARCRSTLVAAVFFAALSTGAAQAGEAARPLGPVLLDGSDSGLRADLAWLVDRGLLPDLTLGTWPMPATIVERALARSNLAADAPLAAADADALARVQLALARHRAPVVLGLGVNSERRLARDAERPVRARAEPELTLQTDAPEWAVRLNARAYSQPLDTRDRSELSADGSFAAADLGPVVVALAAVDRWWGPSLAASPVLGNAATPVPTLMLRRAGESAPEWEPMAWLGPWSWELSLGLPQDTEPSGTNVFGFRLAARPAQGLELGLSRYLYWGGDGRPSGFGSLLRAIVGRSNIDDPTIQGPDPSNEIAGFDLRYSVALPQSTLVGWAHFVGEDEAGSLPSKYFGTIGLQFGHMVGAQRLQWSVEGTDTRLRSFFGLRDSDGAAYSHGAFASGHYNRGLAVGAPMGGGGQQAAVTLDWIPIEDPNALRGQVRLWTAQLARDGSQAINVANLVPGNQRGALFRLQGERSWLRWRADLIWQRDPADDGNPWGATLRLDWPLGTSH